MEAMLESCPSLIIQISLILLSHERTFFSVKPILQISSVTFSFLSVTIAMMANYQVEISAKGLTVSTARKIIIFFLYLLLLLPRLVLWSVFVLYLEEWSYALAIFLVVLNTLVSATVDKHTNWRFDQFITALFDATSNLFVPLFPDSMMRLYLSTAFIFTIPISLLIFLPSESFFTLIISQYELRHFHPPEMTCFNVTHIEYAVPLPEHCVKVVARMCGPDEEPNKYLKLFLAPVAGLFYLGFVFIKLIEKVTEGGNGGVVMTQRARTRDEYGLSVVRHL